MVALQTIPGEKFNMGAAYIALPSDIPREKFIADCYKNCWVTIQTEDGGFHNRVPIAPEVLGFIEFPEKPNELGTPVVYGVDEKYSYLYVISRYMKRDELGDMREGMFKFKRRLDDGFVEVSGSVNDRSVNILVNGGDKPGKIFIRAISNNQDCELDVDVAGNIAVNASGEVKATSHKGITIETIDPDGDDSASIKQTSTEHNVYSKKLVMNDGSEPMVLGKKWKSFMESFIDQVAAITITTMLGIQPILNKVQVEELKQHLDEALSQEGFLKQ
jgi:hypothetical protein